ncbi:hypothetical protein Q7C36_019315 [Tachysurus vachellii]|uniref:Uncharacterized protein n=1 Tax=Tachysurus vachellii TaxID=175792 RepID=A0AA88LW68_TACVA|nr:hypothetical protein Q7C36_019315 [Tachysurus vachellii]
MRGVQWAPAPSLPCLSSQAVSRTPAYGFQTERTALRYGPPAAVTLTGCSAESSPSELDMRYAGRVNQLTAAVPQKIVPDEKPMALQPPPLLPKSGKQKEGRALLVVRTGGSTRGMDEK